MGIFGAIVVLVAFMLGRASPSREVYLRTAPDDRNRYEMLVTPSAEIVRLDRVTGTIRLMTANRIIMDIPSEAPVGPVIPGGYVDTASAPSHHR
jgi:hypothetical protein